MMLSTDSACVRGPRLARLEHSVVWGVATELYVLCDSLGGHDSLRGQRHGSSITFRHCSYGCNQWNGVRDDSCCNHCLRDWLLDCCPGRTGCPVPDGFPPLGHSPPDVRSRRRCCAPGCGHRPPGHGGHGLLAVVLLGAVTAHLATGATASWHHGLAALYIGFSVTYGHRMIAWADTRFAHRFADRSLPVKPTGLQYTKQCWADVFRTMAAVIIAAGIIAAMTWWVGQPARTEALTGWYGVLGIIVAIEIIWAASYSIWPRKVKSPEPDNSSGQPAEAPINRPS